MKDRAHATTRNQIQAALNTVEKEERVRILYACESGSRAWGFESEDSDYDVRFIYIRETARYLTIKNEPDVIERALDGKLDVSGWDFPKSLELLRKSNPPLLEWLQSPIVYRESGTGITRLRELMPLYYSPISCMYHYLHMAQGNFRQYLRGDEVWVKKYFYVLRPVLACQWIERGLGVVPTEFAALIERLVPEGELRRAIDSLLEKKMQGMELDRGTSIPAISTFLESELERLSTEHHQPPAKTRDPAILDQIFLDVLIEAHGNRIRG